MKRQIVGTMYDKLNNVQHGVSHFEPMISWVGFFTVKPGQRLPLRFLKVESVGSSKFQIHLCILLTQ